MATDEFMTADETRRGFGTRLRLANDPDAPVNTVVMVHGHPEAVIVSVAWYRQMRELAGDPVTWQFAPKRKTENADSEAAGS